ncbi:MULTISPECIES: hypothetical protein [unclassified Arthrobacter]|uniref:hypothetical protein n=1 Tax=unclassified Arthrobacter TaxID=235627 RepID=UPI00366F8A5A
MHNVVMNIPASSGIAAELAEAVYARVFPSLVSCLPCLLDAMPGPLLSAGGSELHASCNLWFPSEQDFAMALTSREWVELLDETADVFDWEEVEFASGNLPAPRREPVLS